MNVATLIKKKQLLNGKRLPASAINGIATNNGNRSCSVFYMLNTTYGRAGLCASMDVQSHLRVCDVGDTLHALIMGVIEAKLQFVENWLRCTLDLLPGVERTTHYSKVFTLRDKYIGGSELSIFLPPENWHLIPEFPASALPDEWELRWADQIAHLNVGNILIDNNEFKQLQVGCVVLIPESYGDVWKADLDLSELTVILPGLLDPTGVSWTPTGNIVKAPAKTTLPLRAYKSLRYPQSKNEWFSGRIFCSFLKSSSLLAQNDKQTDLLSGVSLVNQKFTLAFEGHPGYTGHIGPLANGYALFIDAELT